MEMEVVSDEAVLMLLISFWIVLLFLLTCSGVISIVEYVSRLL